MKKITLILSALIVLLTACKKEIYDPINTSLPQKTIKKDSVNIAPSSKDTTINNVVIIDTVNIVDTMINNTIEPAVYAATSSVEMDINFLINPGSNNENLIFSVVDGASTIATLSKANLISVNTEQWSCMDATNTPSAASNWGKVSRVSSIYKDSSFTSDKTYHLFVLITSTGQKTHDFTFQVDGSGNIYNLQTQKLTYVENKFGVQIDDIEIRCNKLIVNYRSSFESPLIFD